jgi:hypothetical protein
MDRLQESNLVERLNQCHAIVEYAPGTKDASL